MCTSSSSASAKNTFYFKTDVQTELALQYSYFFCGILQCL